MGASQSSQPPSRHNSRHGHQTDNHNKHKQKAASISTPMKPHLPPINDIATPSASTPQQTSVPPPVPPAATAVAVPSPSVAVPIPGKKKPVSLPGSSGENSYIDQHKDADLLHRLEGMEIKDTVEEEEEEEEMDEKEVQSKFGIAWVASEDFEDDGRHLRSTEKYPLEIVWSGGGHAVYVLGTFTERKALRLKKTDNVFTITVDAEPGGHRFRFIVDGESRTSPDYRLATDHQNVVVNYLDHMKSDDESDAGSYDSYPEEYDNFISQPPKEVWTREIPKYLTGHIDDSPSSSISSGSSLSRYRSISHSPPQSPALLKGHILNQKVGNGEKKEDSSVLIVPSHSVLGHLGIRTSLSDGLLATTVTMRYHHKYVTTLLYRSIEMDDEDNEKGKTSK